MNAIHDYIRKLAKAADPDKPADSEKPAETSTGYEPESIRVYFSAPDKSSTETVSEEGNFQWIRYEMIFKRNNNHYIYKTPLYAWGLRAPGGQEVLDAKEAVTEEDVTPDEAQRGLAKYLRKPELYPAGLKGTYINNHKSARGKKYPYDVFNRKFRKSDFYKVVSKSKKLVNP